VETCGHTDVFILDAKGIIRYKWAGAPGEKAIASALEKVIREAESNAKTSRE
jgi:hypothetical protein